MPVFFIVIGVVTLGFLAAMLLGLLDVKPAPDPVRPFGHVPLPEGGFTAEDVDDVRFDAVMRGYKMSEVDDVLERMQRRQAELEEQVRGLGGNPGASVGRAGLIEPERSVVMRDAAPLEVAGDHAGYPAHTVADAPGPVVDEPPIAETRHETAVDDSEPAEVRGEPAASRRRFRFGQRTGE